MSWVGHVAGEREIVAGGEHRGIAGHLGVQGLAQHPNLESRLKPPDDVTVTTISSKSAVRRFGRSARCGRSSSIRLRL